MQRIEGSIPYVNQFMASLFNGHGVSAVEGQHCVLFPDHPGLWVDGELFAFNERIVQLDVRLGGFDGDRILADSIVGVGPDLARQADFALQAFANATFHVYLPAFFGRPLCHGTQRESWTISVPRTVYTGMITTVFGYPPATADGFPDVSFYPAFKERIKTSSLSPRTHWIRIYQARRNRAVVSNEVLLDNESWSEMESFMAGLEWPLSDKFYDVRVFMIVKGVE